MSMNWDAVHKLLNITHLANEYPKLHSIRNAALRELDEHGKVADKDNEAAAKKAKEEAEAKAAEAEKERAKIAAEDKAKEDERLKQVERNSQRLTGPQPTQSQGQPEPFLRRNIEEPSNAG